MLDWKVLRRELAVARIKAGLEEDALAAAIGVDVSTIYRIEKSASGKNNPSLDIIDKWVGRCGFSLSAFATLVEGESEKLFAQQIADNGEAGQFSVIKAAPEQPMRAIEHWSSEESSAQPMPSSTAEHGQSGPISPETLAATLLAMQDATRQLRIALELATSETSKALVDTARSDAAPRRRASRKPPGPRKNRKKGPGTA